MSSLTKLMFRKTCWDLEKERDVKFRAHNRALDRVLAKGSTITPWGLPHSNQIAIPGNPCPTFLALLHYKAVFIPTSAHPMAPMSHSHRNNPPFQILQTSTHSQTMMTTNSRPTPSASAHPTCMGLLHGHLPQPGVALFAIASSTPRVKKAPTCYFSSRPRHPQPTPAIRSFVRFHRPLPLPIMPLSHLP